MRRVRAWLPVSSVAAGLLLWSNVVVPRLPTRKAVRTAANLGGALTVISFARSRGISRQELGLDRSSWRAGCRLGAGAFFASVAAHGVGVAVPATRRGLVAPLGEATVRETKARQVLVHIPLGTVLSEELAFRAVLHAVARRRLSERGTAVLTSVVFGLWHVLPALNNHRGHAVVPRHGHVVGTVALTGIGGMVFDWLRRRSSSVLAPMGLHMGVNGVGLLVAPATAATTETRR